jgi:hypothetical protein
MDVKLWLLRLALFEVQQVELIKSGSHGTHTRGTSTQKYPPVGKKHGKNIWEHVNRS